MNTRASEVIFGWNIMHRWTDAELAKHIPKITSWINAQKLLTIEKLANEFEVGQKYRHLQEEASSLM